MSISKVEPQNRNHQTNASTHSTARIEKFIEARKNTAHQSVIELHKLAINQKNKIKKQAKSQKLNQSQQIS